MKSLEDRIYNKFNQLFGSTVSSLPSTSKASVQQNRKAMAGFNIIFCDADKTKAEVLGGVEQ